MRVLLVDDEPLAIERLRVAFATIPETTIIGVAGDGIEAREQIQLYRPDLVVLDIQMPGLSGMELAQDLPDVPHPPEIVFVTAFGRYATEAFGVEATDYLLKPVGFDRLRVAVERVRRRLALREADGQAAELKLVVDALRNELDASPDASAGSAFDDGIWVPGRHSAIRVPVSTIDWIEAARDYVLLNTPTKSHMLRARMNDLEKRLDPRFLLRMHRSHIVNLKSVVAVERPGKGVLQVVLNDGANLQVGPSYQDAVVAALRL